MVQTICSKLFYEGCLPWVRCIKRHFCRLRDSKFDYPYSIVLCDSMILLLVVKYVYFEIERMVVSYLDVERENL